MLATVLLPRPDIYKSVLTPEGGGSAAGLSLPRSEFPAPYPAPCAAARGCPSGWSGSRHAVPGRPARAGSTAPGATCKHAACSSQRARRSSPVGGNRSRSWGPSLWPGPEKTGEDGQDSSKRVGISSLPFCMGNPLKLAKPLSYNFQIKK